MATRIVWRGLALCCLAAALAWAWVGGQRPDAGENPAALPGQLPGQPVVRLRVMEDAGEAQLEIHGRPRIEYPGMDAAKGPQRYGDAPATFTLKPDEGGVRIANQVFSSLSFIPDDGSALVLRWTPDGPGKRPQRYVLQHRLTLTRTRPAAAEAKKARPRLRAVVHLPMESYLSVVVPSEMPAYWPLEALKAQAVAARTYALCNLYERPRAEFHLTFGDMAWDPEKARNSPRVQQAIAETAGIVMSERNRLFPAYFHSECGGYTTDARLALPHEYKSNRYFTALTGVRCERCSRTARDKLEVKGDITLSPADITARLRDAGLLAANEDVLRVSAHANRFTDRGMGEAVPTPLTGEALQRASWIMVQTRQGRQKPILGSQFRTAMNKGRNDRGLTSTYLRISPPGIDGRHRIETQGWGHGAGLCQWGAEQAARVNRLRFPAILQWYYPGVKLSYIYGGPASR